MSTIYRVSRNFEASIIDYLTNELISAGWSVNVEKTFARVYDQSLPVICVRVSDTIIDKAEIGGDSIVRTPTVLIDIFASGDGQRLDLKDFLISILKSGMPYYEYEVTNGVVSSKTQNGRIRTLTISDTIVDLNIQKSRLDIKDRYRHLITLTCSLGVVE